MDVKECTALGRSGYLGAFYDAREDKFCHGSLFKTFNLPDTCVNRVDVTFSNIEYSFEDSYTKRFEKLDVSAELKVSVFAGLLDLKGSGKYLTDDKASSRSVKGTVLYNVRTKQETLNIYDEELKQYISLEGLSATSATHFVGGIVWGANTFASFEYRKTRNSDLSALTGDLSAEMKKIVASIQGQGETRYEGLNENSSYNFDMKVYGDVIPGDEELPKTKKEALALMRKTPTYISTCNNGKGKPITFILYPLTDVAKMMKVELQRQAQVLSIDSASVLQIEHVFNDLLAAKQILNDFYEDLTSPTAPHFSPTLVHDVCTYKNNLEIAESVLRNKIREALVKARMDATQASLLQDVLKDFLETEFCPAKIKQFLASCIGVQEKLDFISDLRAKNVNYLTSKSYGVDSIRSKEKNFYALVFHETDGLYSTEKWTKNYDLFFQLLTNRDEDSAEFSFYVLEFISAECDKDVSIYQCVDSVIETDKLYEVLLVKHSIPLARSKEIEYCAYRPNKSSPVKVRCPGSFHGNCALDVVQWKCDRDKCSSDLYYGYDGYIYCNCGKAKAASFSYKCPDHGHGAKWIQFTNEEDIVKMMEELTPPEEINILILGETGVGKSTFINAFGNYVTFNTLDEAEESNLVSLIPTSFTVTDEDYTEKQVSFGTDSNESGKPGGSQTQACRSYTFPSGDRLIRLIDTPGIGDTNGVDRDVQNFENILSFITNYSILNGICILLKPNNSRISVMFRFCIQELLCHIHRNASENIVFLFTNARGTFYRPGDTLPSLRTLLTTNEKKEPYVKIPLNKSTIYCLDNESFRFLVAKKGEVTFAEEEKENFKGSWDRSVLECARLLEHISKIKPHVISDTISLNEARKLVIFLSKPLCDISQNIQINILNIEDHERKVRLMGEDIAKLEKELYVPVKAWEPKPFDQPRTVCASAKCSTVRSFDDKKISDYTQVCHDPCELEEVTAEILNNPRLLQCWAMNGTNNCRICGCSYEKHMHIYYENEEVEVQKIDTSIEEEIKTKEGVKQHKLKVLQECKARREQLDREQKTITLASAKFAHFLKVNAITPYNDALRDYLHHLIVVEKQKCVNDPDNQRMVEDLTKMKSSYEEQVKILEQNFQNTDDVVNQITPDMINDLVKGLYNLEINGPYIKNAVETQQLVRKKHLAVFSEKMHSPRSYHYATNRHHGASAGYYGQSQLPSLAQIANEEAPKKGIFKRVKNKLREFFFLDYEDGIFPDSYQNGLAYN